MRLLADENMPGAAVEAFAAAGHDIVWVRLIAPGISDPDVLAWALREKRILLTFDKDFGALAAGSGLPPTCGIVLFRLPLLNPRDAGRRFVALLAQRSDWAGHFSVIEPGRIRMRPIGA